MSLSFGLDEVIAHQQYATKNSITDSSFDLKWLKGKQHIQHTAIIEIDEYWSKRSITKNVCALTAKIAMWDSPTKNIQ